MFYSVSKLTHFGQQLFAVLPPYDEKAVAHGHAPSESAIKEYEYKLLLVINFTTSVEHCITAGSPLLAAVLDYVHAPPDLRDATVCFFRTRAYSDCDLCLQEDKVAVILAAIIYVALYNSDFDGGKTIFEPPAYITEK